MKSNVEQRVYCQLLFFSNILENLTKTKEYQTCSVRNLTKNIANLTLINLRKFCRLQAITSTWCKRLVKINDTDSLTKSRWSNG